MLRATLIALSALALIAIGGVSACVDARHDDGSAKQGNQVGLDSDETPDYSITQRRDNEQVQSDNRAGHRPPFVPAFTELRQARRELMFVNRSTAVLSLRINRHPGEKDIADAGRLYPTFAAALASGRDILPSLDMIDVYAKQTDDELVAALETHIHDGGRTFPGGKQGLLTEIIAEIRRGKMDDGGKEAVAFLSAGVLLGGGKVKLSWGLRRQAYAERKRFLDNPFNAKPVGLYTRNQTLEQIFKRDRLLQQPFASEEFTGYSADGSGAHHYPGRSLAAAIRIAEALDRRPDLLKAYTTYLELGHRLTNPDDNLNISDLLQDKAHFNNPEKLVAELKRSPAMQKVTDSWQGGSGKVGIAVWPFTTSKETQLFSRLYAWEHPSGDVMADLIAAIRSGNLDLAPHAGSGWYDYQTYALETLLLPDKAQEAAKLYLYSSYKVRLRRAFESMLTQRRETSFMSLSSSATNFCSVEGGLELDPEDPPVTIEPQPTNYLRTARGYRMLQMSLTRLLGEEDLAAAEIDGGSESVLSRIREARAVFTALYLTSCNEIGMAPELELGEINGVDFSLVSIASADSQLSIVIDNLPMLSPYQAKQYVAACTQGTDWAAKLGESGYMGYDPRVIVPVHTSMDGTYTHYWAVVGVQLAELEFEYDTPPRAINQRQFDTETRQYVELTLDQANEELASDRDLDGYEWYPTSLFVPVYVFREVRLGSEPPTREEYRAVCDRCETVDEIVELLEREFGV